MNQGQSSASDPRVKQENEQITAFSNQAEYTIHYRTGTGKWEKAGCDKADLWSATLRVDHSIEEFAGTTSAEIIRKDGLLCYQKDSTWGTSINQREYASVPKPANPQLDTNPRTSAAVIQSPWIQAFIPPDSRLHNPSLYLYQDIPTGSSAEHAADASPLIADPRKLTYTDLKGHIRTGHCDFETSLYISEILSDATVLTGSPASFTMRNVYGGKIEDRKNLDEGTVRRLDELWPSHSENPDFASIFAHDFWWDTGIEEEFQVRIKEESHE